MPKQYFLKFYSQIEQNLGIVLNEGKQYLIESRLLPLVKKSAHQNVSSLIKELSLTPVGDLHWEAFEALTTNETSFFRDEHVFDGVKNHILPELIKRREKEKTLRIWSAASSTGQEAYSLAMLILDSFPELADWEIFIRGTDVAVSVIETAKIGIYSAHEVKRGLSPERLKKYFIKRESASYQASQNLRSMVSFMPQNLVSDWVPCAKFDLVVLRNVLIYFNQSTRDKVLMRIRDSMEDDGILLLGSSEAIFSSNTYRQVAQDNISYYLAI